MGGRITEAYSENTLFVSLFSDFLFIKWSFPHFSFFLLSMFLWFLLIEISTLKQMIQYIKMD